MIHVQKISKTFKIYASPSDRLKEKILHTPYHHEYIALSDISFNVDSGKTLGIIGENGAGKSTLLKLLAGVLLPDTGIIDVSGKITGLLELGTGFNFDLSGLQNIYMNGTFLGMSYEDIEEKKEAIIEFAELGKFIDEPIKTYSSGMIMRLGFAIAIHADPECFLVDEALSVGDAYFQQKCLRKIKEFKQQGGSIIFVSHDMNAILSISDDVIWLKNGIIQMYGEPAKTVDGYWSTVVDDMNSGSTITPIENNESVQSEVRGDISRSTGHIICKNVHIQDQSGKEISQIPSNEKIRIVIDYYSHHDIINPDYGIQLRDKNGIPVFGVNFVGKKLLEKKHSAGITKRIIYTIRMNLLPGEYFLSLGVANNAQNAELCQFESYLLNIWDVRKITVLLNKDCDTYHGITNLENYIEVIDV